MKTIQILLRVLLLACLGLSLNVQAATLISDGYKYVGLDSDFSTDDGLISQAWYWEGNNISDANFETDLNSELGTSYDFDYIDKTDPASGTSGYVVAGTDITGVLLKASTKNLFVVFNYAVSSFYWNTNFALNSKDKPQGLSHYVVVSDLSDVPVPAALFLFAPALLGLFGVRNRKTA